MTVSYSREVATTKLGTFARLLFRWRGSIYRLLYREMLIYLLLHYFICALYHFAFSARFQRKFEAWAVFCQKYVNLVPLTFVLGFYVSIIIGRWWGTFNSLTWPDRICFQIQSLVGGQDERGRMVRRTVARYLNLAQVLVLRDISSAVRKRFPTLEHLIDGGFFTEEEYKQYECTEMTHHKFWIPLQWTCSLLTRARKEGLIEADPTLVKIMEEVLQARNNLNSLICYDWISVPLVYTQVVTIAVYSYFLACLFGRQHLIRAQPDVQVAEWSNEGSETDMYFPMFTLLQFLFYMGWLKVAESIMNPLGEDDDDFEVNYLIDRNLQVAYFIVDDNCMKIPPLKRDIHWNEPETNVPHTQESVGLKVQPYVPSAVLNALQESSDLKTVTSKTSLAMCQADGIVPKRTLSFRQNSNAPSATSLKQQISNESNANPANEDTKHSFRRLISNVSRKLRPASSECQFQIGTDLNELPLASPKISSVSNPDDRLLLQTVASMKHILSTVSEAANEDTDSANVTENGGSPDRTTPLVRSTASATDPKTPDSIVYIDNELDSPNTPLLTLFQVKDDDDRSSPKTENDSLRKRSFN